MNAISVISRRWGRQFCAFAGVGVVATGIQYAVLLFAVRVLRLDPVSGSSAGFAISAVFNYLLNYHFTFQSSNTHASAASRFALVTATGFLLNGGIMLLLVQSMQMPYVMAQLVATAAVMSWNFLGSALWTFSSPAGQSKAAPRGERE